MTKDNDILKDIEVLLKSLILQEKAYVKNHHHLRTFNRSIMECEELTKSETTRKIRRKLQKVLKKYQKE